MIDNDTYQFLAFLDLICLPRGYRNESCLILLYHLIEQENDFGYIKTKYLSISWKYWGSGSAMFLMEVTQQVFLILVLLVLILSFRVSFAIENNIFLRFPKTILDYCLIPTHLSCQRQKMSLNSRKCLKLTNMCQLDQSKSQNLSK